jgi:membrane-bound lytic murein transglycosylase B
MQGLADGYFVIPTTIANYLATQTAGSVTTEHPAFAQVEGEVRERIAKLLSIKGKRTVDSFHRDLGKIIWDKCGMERSAEGLRQALQEIPAIREEFWSNVRIPGSGAGANMELEKAGRVADFIEPADEEALAALKPEADRAVCLMTAFIYPDETAARGAPAGAAAYFRRRFRMIRGWQLAASALAIVAMVATLGAEANAAQCGNGPGGFEAWKEQFAGEARAKGVGATAIDALMQAHYASATIAADRGQRSFGLSLEQFMAKRGSATIVARGRSLKQSQAAMFASIQQRYGVPPGPLIAIWGMESGFGSQRGNQNMLSSIATLAYDCRRPEFFTEQLYAALKLIDRGSLSGSTRGSMHGEIGQTQFMPKNVLAYGTGNLDVAANALASTANFLRANGWRAGAGYQPGEPNFAAIEAWNAAGVYQKAIAIMGRQIDGQ